jgi:hypothetical protein
MMFKLYTNASNIGKRRNIEKVVTTNLVKKETAPMRLRLKASYNCRKDLKKLQNLQYQNLFLKKFITIQGLCITKCMHNRDLH